MKKLTLYITAVLGLAMSVLSCSQKYELNLPMAVDREELRFRKEGNTYYVRVWSEGKWKAQLEREVSWLQLSAVEGDSDGQILLTAEKNSSVSRGVSLKITNLHGEREVYVSQESGAAEGGYFSFAKDEISLMKNSSSPSLRYGTNLGDETISCYETELNYEDGDGWIEDISISDGRLRFKARENDSGDIRRATIKFTFPTARWDTPVTSFLNVTQSVNEPAYLEAAIDNIGSSSPGWSEDERIAIVNVSGGSPVYAEQEGSDGARFMYDADALMPGDNVGIYPEEAVSGQNLSSVKVISESVKEPVSTLTKAAELGLMAGALKNGTIRFRSVCSILRLNLQGGGRLKSFTLMAEKPISGEGTIDIGGSGFLYVPDSAKGSNEISLNISGEGIELPAELYIPVPAGDLGQLTVMAETDNWSGIISCGEVKGSTGHQIVGLEEISLTIPSDALNLSEGGHYANCYLVEDKSGRVYSFETKMPDGNLPADDITSCSCLWQSSPSLLTYLGIDAAAGKVYFRRNPGESGNALIGLHSADGTVRWSIHLWFPATALETRRAGDYVFMDRNLGAMLSDADDFSNSSIGLHYQWGRKDPFPPVSEMRGAGNYNHAKVYPDNISFETAQDGVSQQYADAHPTTYFWGKAASGKEDWIDVQDDGLWSSSVSRSNPCPYGWQVATRDAFSQFDYRVKEAQYIDKVGITIADDDGKPVLFAPGGWYRRTVSTTQICSADEVSIWTSTAVANGDFRGSYRFRVTKGSSRGVVSIYPQRRWGANVRCIKVQ